MIFNVHTVLPHTPRPLGPAEVAPLSRPLTPPCGAAHPHASGLAHRTCTCPSPGRPPRFFTPQLSPLPFCLLKRPSCGGQPGLPAPQPLKTPAVLTQPHLDSSGSPCLTGPPASPPLAGAGRPGRLLGVHPSHSIGSSCCREGRKPGDGRASAGKGGPRASSLPPIRQAPWCPHAAHLWEPGNLLSPTAAEATTLLVPLSVFVPLLPLLTL